MAFKYQVFLCPRPKDLLLISYNHIDTIREFVKDTPVVMNQVDETHRKIIEVSSKLWTLNNHLLLNDSWYVTKNNCVGRGCTGKLVHTFAAISLVVSSSVQCFCTCRSTPLYQKVNSSFSGKHCSYFFKTCMSGWVLSCPHTSEMQIY